MALLTETSSGNPNYVTVRDSLSGRLTSLPVLLDVVTPKIVQAENSLSGLEQNLDAVNRQAIMPLLA